MEEKDTIRCVWHEGTLIVTINDQGVPLEPSQKVFNHSREFSIGYSGSGVAQLALAILLMYKDLWMPSLKKGFTERDAVHLHQDFKFDFLTDPSYQEGKMREDHPFEIQVNMVEWITRHMGGESNG